MKRQDQILIVRNLKKHFTIDKKAFSKPMVVRAVDDVSLELTRRETLGIVGETGCGKSTLARAIIRLYQPDDGQILFVHDGRQYDLAPMNRRELAPLRPQIQYVFQDPFSSLNQRMTIEEILCEPLTLQKRGTMTDRVNAAADMLSQVGLPNDMLKRYPHEFSGGQRQRIVLARALILQPSLVLCDEPVSALDLASQAQILNLFRALQQKYGLSYLFIAHDLRVVQYISDRIAVMYLGRIVEIGPSDPIYRRPLHPYTRLLIDSIPSHDAVVKPSDAPAEVKRSQHGGCNFFERCPIRTDQCGENPPPLRHIGANRQVACYMADQGG